MVSHGALEDGDVEQELLLVLCQSAGDVSFRFYDQP
jgi:hypothetical protein